MIDVELVLAANDELGEGPVWHPNEQVLYWVDIEARRYHRFDPASGEHEVVPVGEKVGVLAFRQQGGLVVASEYGFSFFDPSTRTLERIGDPEKDKPQTQFNDGAVDRLGRFWAGTLGDPFQNSLYRLAADGTITLMDSGFDICNGIGWSPDNRVMYFIDSTPEVVYAYDFELTSGCIANRRIFIDRGGQQGVPDGLTVDAEGFVWIAIWDGSRLERYDPHGKLERTLALPVQFPTSMAFGGANLEDLYITSALYEIPPSERARFPLAGGLFRVRGAGKGLAEPMFGS
jgi:sugar lactone lactonase YvrE